MSFLRSCDIKRIRELTGSKSDRDFKRDLIKDNNFAQKLKVHKFDFSKFWNSTDKDIYSKITNDASEIKLKKY